MCNFVHLHNHTAFSLGDSTAMPDLAVKRAADLGYKSYAITDHGTMSGVLSGFESKIDPAKKKNTNFYKSCIEYGIKPILGVEAYLTEDITGKGGYYHLLLLAKTLRGYQSLLQATTIAHTEGFSRRPRIDWEILANIEDVIVTTACVGGPLIKDFLNSDYNNHITGQENLQRLKAMFGDNLFVELQVHGSRMPEMFYKTNQYAMEMAKRYGVRTVMTNDIHFVDQTDMEAHRMWVALGQGKTIDRLDYFYDESFYIKSAEEMRGIAPNSECCDTTLEINDMIDFIDLNLGISYMPSFEDMTTEQANQKLIEITRDGLIRAGKANDPVYLHRAAEELDFLMKNDLSRYFLPIWDALNFASDQCIPIGPGRGSAGGSLVVNMMDITALDPIEHGLKFSRFLNPGRVSRNRVWKVELVNGQIMDIVDKFEYHVKDDKNEWVTMKGEEIVNQFQTVSGPMV